MSPYATKLDAVIAVLCAVAAWGCFTALLLVAAR